MLSCPPEYLTFSNDALAMICFLLEQLAILKVATRAGRGWTSPVLAATDERIAAILVSRKAVLP